MRAVFIGGCERSGTTFLGSLLGSHPECITTPESHYKVDPLIYETERRQCTDEHVIRAVERHPQFGIWNVRLEDSEGATLASPDRVMYAIVQAYGRKIGRTETGVWIDHTPSNINHVLRLRKHFPGVRFLNVVRDGRAVTASLRRLRFGPNSIKACVDHWRGRIANGLAAERALSSSEIMRVPYERLVLETDVLLQSICAFLELDFRDDMLRAGGFSPEEFGRKVNPLVGSPPDRKRLMAWKDSLSPREIEIFEALTGDLLPSLGYELSNGALPHGPSWPEKLGMDLKEITRRTLNAPLYRWNQRRHGGRGGPGLFRR